jgi:hypothetical protein
MTEKEKDQAVIALLRAKRALMPAIRRSHLITDCIRALEHDTLEQLSDEAQVELRMVIAEYGEESET